MQTFLVQILILWQIFRLSSSVKIPDDFLFGVSTASYQIEGAWNESGKGENIWDHFVHQSASPITDFSTGDIAADAYHKLETDIELLKNLKVQAYRFSISWARIYPQGFKTKNINAAGVDYYNLLINSLLENNIIPFVTIYHWDLPQTLQDLGGWTNPLTINHYVDYADTLFKLYGDRVKFWITFNEPLYHCDGYANGRWAPGIKLEGIANYLCDSIVLKAHAKVYRLYEKKYKEPQKGQVGITIGYSWFKPYTNSLEDIEATERLYAMDPDLYAHPIFSTKGDFSPILKNQVAKKSKEQQFVQSRLPEFNEDEISMIKGTADFLGINHYTSNLVRNAKSDEYLGPVPSYDDDLDVVKEVDPSWPGFEARSSMKVYPKGFYNILKRINQEYGNLTIYVTENGYADYGKIEDKERAEYMKNYITEMANAIEEGIDVRGYFAWSFLDNFEWTHGYTQRYGLYHVDFNDPERKRTPKLSSSVYREIIENREVSKIKFCNKGVSSAVKRIYFMTILLLLIENYLFL